MSNVVSEFKIAMIAPSRIGKTSLVTALLQDTKKLLVDTPLSIKAKDAKTSARINQHANQLRASLREREFNAGAMNGTEAPFEFNLLLGGQGQDDHGLNLKLLDFPGGWLPSLLYDEDNTQEQRECAAFIRKASMLVLVVDASLVMEASRSDEKKAIDTILQIYETQEIVEAWAKERHEDSEEPALIVICPVKCESYFNDNGGKHDCAEKLYDKIMELYGPLVDSIKEQKSTRNTEILYMPVDTIGCVEFSHAEWSDLDTHTPVFKPSFRVRGNGKQNVFGANDILLAVAKQILSFQTKYQKIIAQLSKEDAENAKNLAKEKGVFEHFLGWFGVETEKEKLANLAESNAEEALKEATTTEALMKALGHKKYGARVKELNKAERA